MELPIANPDIVSLILIYVSPDSLPPYDMVCLMAVVFAAACWFASRALKQLRKSELELRRKVSNLNRQRVRDGKTIAELSAKLDEIAADSDSSGQSP